LTPNDSVLQTRLNDYYILAGQFDKAIARLEPIVLANPGDEYHSDILLNAYVNARMEDKALALFKKRLEREPRSAGLTARYAQALETFGQKSEAIKQWEKAAQLDPSNGFFVRRANDLKNATK
jgi:pentatricopeptide repeat protein